VQTVPGEGSEVRMRLVEDRVCISRTLLSDGSVLVHQKRGLGFDLSLG